MATTTTPPNPDDGRPGRPTKLTPAIQEAICAALRCHSFRGPAAKAAGVGLSTMRRWLQLGRQYPDGEYGRFRAAVLEAEGKSEVLALATINVAGHTEDPKHLEWLLERKHPHRWGRARGDLKQLQADVAELRRLLGATPDQETPA